MPLRNPSRTAGRRSDVQRGCTVNGKSRVDHVIPKSKGGCDGPRNRVLCCGACDSRKGNLTPAELVEWALRVAAVAEAVV
jgi:5-methylcytosine-specific restriction endonuclease McrA